MAAQLLTGLVLACLIGAAAFRARVLNRSGAVAAAALGTVIFGLGGLGWAVLLLSFFISSSGLSKLMGRRKTQLVANYAKGSRRDAGQVLANGGIAGLFALLHGLLPGAVWPWIGFAAALAAANADTWATELGVLNRTPPRLITSGRVVPQGTSGGVSLTGTAAALSGSALIALLAVALWNGHVLALPSAPAWLQGLVSAPVDQAVVPVWLGRFALLTLAGLAGSLVDSLLGATVQAMYTCPTCQKVTERHPLHACGTPTVLQRGLPWMNNDAVNALCTAAAALLALLLI